jgi:hypothetical protein
VSLEHTLFLDFLKLFVNMRLALSFAGKQKSYFWDLRIKSYGCLKFQGEVWAGRACAGANQQELTTCTKKGEQEKKKISQKMGTTPQAQVSTRGRRATAGRWPALGRRPLVAGLPATSGWGLVARQRPGLDRWSPVSRRPEVVARRSVA